MIGWLAAVAGASLLGSLHCAGMCGGFVGCLAGSAGYGAERGSVARRVRLHGAYHIGRLVGYLALGAAAGTLGAGIEKTAWLAGVRGAAPIICGGLIVLFALAALARALGMRTPHFAPRGASRAIASVLSRLRDRGPAIRGGALGLLTALLPCGWLWAFVATAAGTGTTAGGIATMAAFWLGTVPILAGLGLGADRLWRPLRARLPLASAALLLAVGFATAAGFAPLPPSAPPTAALADSAGAGVSAGAGDGDTPLAIPESAPCCHGK
jgi:sulfite exporter TauE/SafE